MHIKTGILAGDGGGQSLFKTMDRGTQTPDGGLLALNLTFKTIVLLRRSQLNSLRELNDVNAPYSFRSPTSTTADLQEPPSTSSTESTNP